MKRYSSLDSALIRVGSFLATRQRERALAILLFHRVLPHKDPLLPSEPDAEDFSALIDLLAAHFNILPLSGALALMNTHRLPPRAVCITFDDGYANNYNVALPILSARRIPATVFIASGFLDGGRMFNDTIIEALRCAPSALDLRDIGLGLYQFSDAVTRARVAEEIIRTLKHLEPSVRAQSADVVALRAGLPADSRLMMTREEVRRLHRAGVEIGAHTVTHPILTALDAENARREITAGKSDLETIIGSSVALFAYPNGKPGSDYDRREVELAKEAGFKAAFSTAWGTAVHGCDFFQIPRIAPWGRSPLRYGLQLATSYRRQQYVRAG